MSDYAKLYQRLIEECKTGTKAELMQAVSTAMEGMGLSERLDFALYVTKQLSTSVEIFRQDVAECHLEIDTQSRKETVKLLSKLGVA